MPPICRSCSRLAILLLTPLAFLLSTARNSRQLSDVLALVLGLALYPLASRLHTGVDILISGYRRRHDRLRRALVAGARTHWLSNFFGDPQALLVLVIAGFLPNEVWRMLGLWLGGGVDEGSEVLIWVRAVATAILAGVIAQILVQPPGALASVPDWLRLRRGRRGLCGVHADAALDLCRRGLRRGRDGGRKMVARLIAAAA